MISGLDLLQSIVRIFHPKIKKYSRKMLGIFIKTIFHHKNYNLQDFAETVRTKPNLESEKRMSFFLIYFVFFAVIHQFILHGSISKVMP